MSDIARSTTATDVLIIEDLEEDYRIIREIVDNVIARLNPSPVAERLCSKTEVEEYLKKLKEQGTAESAPRVLVIFDRSIEREDGPYVSALLDDYINSLWNLDHRTKQGRLRVIVYSIMPDRLRGLSDYPHNHYVYKIQQGAREPQDVLERAIQDAVSSF